MILTLFLSQQFGAQQGYIIINETFVKGRASSSRTVSTFFVLLIATSTDTQFSPLTSVSQLTPQAGDGMHVATASSQLGPN